MFFSCKLSNTAILYLESEGYDVTDFLLQLPWNESMLTDPGQALPATDMELFFIQLTNWLNAKKAGGFLATDLRQVAHSAFENRSWGILDSVLRMMPNVHEVWQRPSKLLGHFIDPPPEVHQVLQERSFISFECPLNWGTFPLSQEMLLGSMEILPRYMGAEPAQCALDGNQFLFVLQKMSSATQIAPVKSDKKLNDSETTTTTTLHSKIEVSINPQGEALAVESVAQVATPFVSSVEVSPSDTEVALSNEEALFHSLILSPEAFREMVAVVEKPLKPRKKKKLSEANESGPKQLALDQQWDLSETEEGEVSEVELENLQQNLNRILDFFVRATQLVTLMSQQDPEKAKAWMRRLHWDRVREEFPGLFEESVDLIKKIKNQKESSHV